MKRDLLIKKLARLEAKKAKLSERARVSEDVAEIRDLTEQMEDVNAEIAEVTEEIAACDEAERSAEVPADATLVNGLVRGTFVTEARAEAPTESIEYRNAFMAYVQKGTAIPAEFRNGETTSTADVGAAIPMTVMNEVINTVRKKYGNLYAKVRKLNVRGGVEIPVGALQATFKWINERTVSPRQKAGELGKISFSYHTAEIRVSQTFLAQLLTLSSFEARLAEIIAEAYLQAMDEGIVAGSGNGCMLGIVNDPRVTNVVSMTQAKFDDWTKWRSDFFAKLPLGYRSGEFIFAASTVDAHLETMHDNANNPIFHQAAGLEVDEANATGRFFGREVSLVEPDIVADFDAASAGDVVGIYWQPDQYAINENFGFTMRRYFDEETNEWVDKAIVVVDGKILNPNGFYLIKKA